jgi:sporulation integral membrane protein YtvI
MLSDGANRKIEFIISVAYYSIIAVLIYSAYRLIGITLPFGIALALVAVMQPSVRWLHKKLGANQKLLSIIVIAIIYAGAGAVLFWLFSQLFIILKGVLTELPDYYKNAIDLLFVSSGNAADFWISDMSPELREVLLGIQGRLFDWLQELVLRISQTGTSALSGLLNGIPGFFLSLLITIVLSFLISTQYEMITRFLEGQVPEKAAATLTGVRKIVKDTVFKYAKAQIILMLITFAEATIGMLAVGAHNPIGVAALIAFIDLMPVLGAGSVLLPWAIIELLQGSVHFAIGLAIVYITISIIRRIIEPKVVGDQLGIHPIIALLSIYVGWRLVGIWGMVSFPIIIQILLAMHKEGKIKLFKEVGHAHGK